MLLHRGGRVYHCFKGVDLYLIVSKGWVYIPLYNTANNRLHQTGSHIVKGSAYNLVHCHTSWYTWHAKIRPFLSLTWSSCYAKTYLSLVQLWSESSYNSVHCNTSWYTCHAKIWPIVVQYTVSKGWVNIPLYNAVRKGIQPVTPKHIFV